MLVNLDREHRSNAMRGCKGRMVVAFVLAAALGCSRAHDEGPPMRIQDVELSLLVREDLRRVVEERAGDPVSVVPLGPGRDVPWDGTSLPCLEMTPPARVEIALPPLPPGAKLRLAAGLDLEAYELAEGGTVAFAIETDGKPSFRAELPFGAGVPAKTRVWNRAELPLDGVHELVLSTRVLGADVRAPAGFGLLEIVSQREVPSGRASRTRPNVVVFLVDTLRADRMSAYGYERPTSPRFDAFAKRGALHELAFSASSWTFPSTASIFTSLSPPEHGVESHLYCFLAQEHLTMAEVFQDAGWTTAAWVVNPLVHSERDFDQGFGTFHESTWTKAGEIVSDVQTWLTEHGEKRFFLYLHLGDPHEYRPSEPYRARFSGPAPEGFSMQQFRELNEASRGGKAHDEARLAAFVTHMSGLYDAAVAEVDAAFGVFLDTLEASGHGDDTLIVFTSDHGEAFLEHGLCLHGAHLYDEFVHVPLAIAGPGVAAGGRVASRVENRFLAPTLCALAGIERRGNIDGPSLLDAEAIAARAREPIFFSTRQGLWTPRQGTAWTRVGELDAVRRGELFYLRAPQAPDGEVLSALYDLAADPAARVDLSATRAAEAQSFGKALDDWQARGARVRPKVLGGGRAIQELMQQMGYIGPEEGGEAERDEH